MKIVCISDTHTLHEEVEVPEGDLLIHAGDFSDTGKLAQVARFFEWFDRQAERFTFGGVVIAGNHDMSFDPKRATPEVTEMARKMASSGEYFRYLENSGCEVNGLKVWGSPATPWFFNWGFNYMGEEIVPIWNSIPEGTDVLVTHGPPMWFLDTVPRGEHVGCRWLLDAVERVKPKLHVFGHIHDAHGMHVNGGTIFVNAAQCDEGYGVTNRPVVVEVE